MTAQSALKESRLALVGPSEAVAEPATTHGREWWGAYMDDEAYVRLILAIEVEKGRMTTHEQVCAERWKNIDTKMVAFQTALDKVVAAVGAGNGRAGKWKDKILLSTIAVLFAFGSWAAGQLWSLLPLHH